MSLKVRFVTRGVITQRTHVVLLATVDRQVTLKKRLPTKVAATEAAHVAIAVKDEDMIAEGSLVLEDNAAALQRLVAFLVHGGYVSLEVILAVGNIPTLRATE